VIVPEALERRISAAAQRRRLSKSAYVRRAIERALPEDRSVGDPLDRLSKLGDPTADIEQMVGEPDSGLMSNVLDMMSSSLYICLATVPPRSTP
jgi:hypothetical protein